MRDRHAGWQQRIVDLAIEEQIFEHPQLGFLAIEFGAQIVDVVA